MASEIKQNEVLNSQYFQTDLVHFGKLLDLLRNQTMMSLTELHGFITAALTFSWAGQEYWHEKLLNHYQLSQTSELFMEFEQSLLHIFDKTKEGLSRVKMELILFDGEALASFNTANDDLIRDWCRGYLSPILDEEIWQYDTFVLGILQSIGLWAQIVSSEQGMTWEARGMALSEFTRIPHRAFVQIALHLVYFYWHPIQSQFQEGYFFCSCGSQEDFRTCCYENKNDFD